MGKKLKHRLAKIKVCGFGGGGGGFVCLFCCGLKGFACLFFFLNSILSYFRRKLGLTETDRDSDETH